MATSVSFNGGELQDRLDNAGPRARAYLAAVTDSWAAHMETDAKVDAPWTDRTGNARNGLFARGVINHPEYAIVLAHSVNYGIWLEVRWGGRYSVIMPTLLRDGPQYMDDVARVLGAI